MQRNPLAMAIEVDRTIDSAEIPLRSNLTPVVHATAGPTFHAGERVILTDGPHKYMRGRFVELFADGNLVSIIEGNGTVSNHRRDWVSRYESPSSYYTLSGRMNQA